MRFERGHGRCFAAQLGRAPRRRRGGQETSQWVADMAGRAIEQLLGRAPGDPAGMARVHLMSFSANAVACVTPIVA